MSAELNEMAALFGVATYAEGMEQPDGFGGGSSSGFFNRPDNVNFAPNSRERGDIPVRPDEDYKDDDTLDNRADYATVGTLPLPTRPTPLGADIVARYNAQEHILNYINL